MVRIENIVKSRLVAVAVLVLAMAGQARADRIVLRGGTQIRGVILPNSGQPDQVLVQTESLITPIKYRKDQVTQVISEPSALKDYLDKRDQTKPDAQSQFDLGLWCEQQKLAAFAEHHYRRAIESDKAFAPAHKKLGHVLHGERWVTNDELREAQGLVKYKGKWMSKEEKDKIDAHTAEAADHAAWGRRIKVLCSALLSTSPQRRQEAEAQLAAIRDPAAVAPLLQILGKDTEEMRARLAQILGSIPGPEAASALVARVLAETETSVREATMTELARRDEPNVIPQLVRALKSHDLAVVNRAAWALANLDAVSAVPKLVQALVVVDQRLLWIPPDATAPSGGNIGVSFSSVSPVPYVGSGAIGATGGTVASAPGVSNGGYYLPFGVNSVTVGPGVVAFGAGAPPYIVGTGVGLSAGDSGPSRDYQPRFVRYTYRNIEVLNALQKLTRQNFGFDVDAWRHWLNTSFRAESTPARRVPQP